MSVKLLSPTRHIRGQLKSDAATAFLTVPVELRRRRTRSENSTASEGGRTSIHHAIIASAAFVALPALMCLGAVSSFYTRSKSFFIEEGKTKDINCKAKDLCITPKRIFLGLRLVPRPLR